MVIGNEATENRNGRLENNTLQKKWSKLGSSLDSAADNAATARDPHNQAIYPIRRPANVFDLETSAVGKLKTTFNDVFDICGLSAGDKCDPEKSTINKT